MFVQSTPIKHLPNDDQPREKLLNRRPASLTQTELLAILIGSGCAGCNALELARKILNQCGNDLCNVDKLSFADLMKIKGIGPVKAASIVAAFELNRRRMAEDPPDRYIIRSSKDALQYIRSHLLPDNETDRFGALFLAQSGWVRSAETFDYNGRYPNLIDPRQLIKKALESGAVSLITFQSCNTSIPPASSLYEPLITRLNKAGQLLDIKLLDHIILNPMYYFSLADHGLLG